MTFPVLSISLPIYPCFCLYRCTYSFSSIFSSVFSCFAACFLIQITFPFFGEVTKERERAMRVNANKNVKRELIATSGAATGWLAGSKLPYQNFCTPLKNIFNQMIHSLFMLWSLSHCMSSEHTHCTNGTIANVGNIYLRTHKFRTYTARSD